MPSQLPVCSRLRLLGGKTWFCLMRVTWCIAHLFKKLTQDKVFEDFAMLDTWVQQITAPEVCWKHTQTLIFNSQWGLSLAPARRSSLAMGTLLVMMAISRGRRPSLFGVLRSSSSKLYWDNSSCTKSSSWCSTASNSVSLLWNCYGKMMHMKLLEMKQNHFIQTNLLTKSLANI